MKSLEDDPRVGAVRAWAVEGIRVWAPTRIASDGRLQYCVCEVIVAAGDLVRVRSMAPLFNGRHFDAWRRVEDLFDYVKVVH